MQGALGGILCSGGAPHLLAVCALRAERLLQVVGETVDCALDGVHERRTECKFAPHQWVLDDGASELAAFAGVVASEVPCLFSNAQRRRADFEPPQIQRIQCDIRARAFLAQPIRSGHGNPFEHHAAGGRAVQPQFVFLALHEQAGRTLYQKRRKAFAVHLREGHEQVSKARVRNPDFVARDSVVVARAFGAGASCERIGACVGFRERVCADEFARRQFRQVVVLLRLRAE
jgi:hypothetical protein